MATLPDPLKHRTADHPIETLFLKRWSPRAMSGAAVSRDDVMRLLEAARWAPSTYNVQEWRFLYAHRDTAHWDAFFGLLAEANQGWCVNAGVLILVAAHTVFERNGKPNPVHEFDAGLASQNLLLQGASMGLVVHAMAGFDREAAPGALSLPDDVKPVAMIAVGHPGDPDALPDGMRDGDLAPSGRNPVAEFAREGPFAP